ncbi:MAG TPA: cytochrome C oxidase subunit IV family protein [Acidobacteriota bacterium]|nr:cytochrome C oxidase subunit IV family protein [Acidobacteriota bacterium]
MGHDMSEEEIQKHVRIYMFVFGALLTLTVITVAASYLHHVVPMSVSIAIALLIAIVKGSLVACYFMHLIDERKMIYLALILTAFFFLGLLLLPFLTNLDQVQT